MSTSLPADVEAVMTATSQLLHAGWCVEVCYEGLPGYMAGRAIDILLQYG